MESQPLRPKAYRQRVESYSNLQEVLVLEEVSRLTLEGPPSPPLSPATFETPQIRKRKPSIVVTPPRGDGCRLDFDAAVRRSSDSFAEAPVGALPLMPDSESLDATSSYNPFKRHRPMHSPIEKFSHFNLDFCTKLQDSDARRTQSPNAVVRLPAALWATSLPNLEDSHEVQSPTADAGSPLSSSPVTTLKMRRVKRDGFPSL